MVIKRKVGTQLLNISQIWDVGLFNQLEQLNFEVDLGYWLL